HHLRSQPSPYPTTLLAETWELPSLSHLACIPYYKHSGCKIIQCPRTPLCWMYGPAAGTRINRALLCCLLHHHLGRGITQYLLVGIRPPSRDTGSSGVLRTKKTLLQWPADKFNFDDVLRTKPHFRNFPRTNFP